MRSLPFRLLSLGVAFTLGAGALAAQTPTDTARAPRAGQMQRAGRGGPAALLLKDITLTDAQQARVKELHQQFAQQRKQLVGDRQGRRPQGADRQQGQQRPDSATRAAWRAERQAMRGKMQQLTERQFADLRAVLTPAQQPTFDRNLAALKQRMTERQQRTGVRGFRRGAAAGSQGHAGHGAASGR